MGLSTLIQIQCHHVLANEIALNLKYCMGLKQNFNIILGITIIKKTSFVLIFNISPCVFTFDEPRYPINKKYLKKRDDDT